MKHHSHQVVVPRQRAIQIPLEQLSKGMNCKITRIEEQASKEVMLTRYFYTHDVEAIKLELDKMAKTLRDGGWKVLKTKIEHQGLHLVKTFSPGTYAESHIKIAISQGNLEEKLEILKEVAPKRGFWVSRNPREKTSEGIIQFVNFKFETGTPEQAIKQVNEALQWLANLGFDILEVKRELVVFAS